MRKDVVLTGHYELTSPPGQRTDLAVSLYYIIFTFESIKDVIRPTGDRL